MIISYIHAPSWNSSPHGIWLSTFMTLKQARQLARLDPMMIIRV